MKPAAPAAAKEPVPLRGGYVEPRAASAFRSHGESTVAAAAALRLTRAALGAAALLLCSHVALPRCARAAAAACPRPPALRGFKAPTPAPPPRRRLLDDGWVELVTSDVLSACAGRAAPPRRRPRAAPPR
jgi:hypothetical protein